MPTDNNTHSTKKNYYIVENAQGEKFLLPYFAETFRVLMDDKETIRDILNSLLGLDRDHEQLLLINQQNLFVHLSLCHKH